MNILKEKILAKADPSKVAGLSRFFKCGPGQYGEGDEFLGIMVPVTRSVVKECWSQAGFPELEECLGSRYHELRLAALLVLVEKFRHAGKDREMQQACVDFYLSHTSGINNWDLVDLSCYPLLGEWLKDRDRTLLYELARDGKTLWERRIGMVSTLQLIRAGELDDTYAIAGIFLGEAGLHDLLQKAVGWMLREAGKRDEARLKEWLEPRASTMPRTMLRYAIEKFPEDVRKHFMAR